MAYGFNDDKSKYELIQPEVLWTNPSPSASFGEQTINIGVDLSEYTYFEIIYNMGSQYTYRYSTGLLLATKINPSEPDPSHAVATTDFQLEAVCPTGSGYNMFTRHGQIQFGYGGNHANFDDGKVYTSQSSAGTTSTTVCVPYQILGYK